MPLSVESKTSFTLGIVILAAGASRRMGEPKQLLQWSGETLLAKAIREAKKVASKLDDARIVIVLGSKKQLVKKSVSMEGCIAVYNPRWRSGMASSLRCGVTELCSIAKLDAILINTCDQPFVDAAHLLKLIKKYRTVRKGICATSYSDTIGVPAIFSRSYFTQLLLLRGDQGAKFLINENASDLSTLRRDAAAIDVDTPTQYKQALKLLKLNPKAVRK